MQQRWIWAGGVILAVGLIATGQRAEAFITRPTPLRLILLENPYIFTTRVEKVDPNRPGAVFLVEQDLKGKFPHRRMPVNLTGDEEGQKHDHPAKLLKRIAPKLPLVLFCNERGKQFTAFGYTNGTWFQLVAMKADGGQPVVWRFTHCEPYLRRTFKGTTEEMRQTVIDGLSGKKKPPEYDPKEAPGLGPEVKQKTSGRAREASSPRVATRGLWAPGTGGAPFAVIPTLGVGGPLAILAVLFPSLFGGVLLLFKRWAAFFTVISVNSLLYCLHLWFAGDFLDAWWSPPAVLWFVMTLVTLAGAVWAWRRHVRTLTGDQGLPEAPPRTEHLVLWLLSVSCLVVVLFCLFSPPQPFEPWWNLLLAFSFGIWAGTVYKLYHSLVSAPCPAPAAPRTAAEPVQGQRPGRPALPTEGVMLWVVLLGFITFAALRPGQRSVEAADNVSGEGRAAVRLDRDGGWRTVFDGTGVILSSPLVTEDRVYVAAARGAADTFGSLYCLDLKKRGILWTFDNDGAMKQVFCSPVLADGRIYIGEGFHQDKRCHLYCIDAESGKERWKFLTASHTESTPVVVGGKVYFGAGDDGVYCVDAVTGKKIWQFPDGERRKKLHLHCDASPAVVGKCVYVCGGIDEDTGKGDAVLACLDADTGKEIWLRETPRWMVRRGGANERLALPAWGGAVVDGGQVFFGVGNGRMTEDSNNYEPVGALLCVDAATGKDLWPPFKVGNGVLNRPALDRHRVYFGARDGFCYCLDRRTGKLRWKTSLGSPVVATPAVDACPSCGHSAAVYAVAIGGQVCCLDPYTGKVHWSFDDLMKLDPLLVSSPAVAVTHTPEGDRRRIYFGAALNNQTVQALYCLEDLSPER
jgi:outer membrane protein assembly factor BamB